MADIQAIIPAAGVGSRLAADRPKQYLEIHGQPMIWHSIQALLADHRISKIHIGLSPDDHWFDRLFSHLDPRVQTHYCGGATRAETVLNTLVASQAAGWVLVHDAARPGLPSHCLSDLISTCLRHRRGGLLAVPVPDTVKRCKSVLDDAFIATSVQVLETVSRHDLYLAQTPQMFPVTLLQAALEKTSPELITDEASAVESLGIQPLIVRGHWKNFKVTWLDDLELIEKVLSS